MAKNILRIATRKSPLALWQAQEIRDRLLAIHPNLIIELIPITTQGDIILDTSLAKVGGKGLFVKELEIALLEGRADIAVHSMKDVPIAFPAGLGLAIICQREDPHDAFVSHHYNNVDHLPIGSVVGTSSLRRQCQLRQRRPDLVIRELRGNVGTRLGKLDKGDYDAIILAAAGLKRLGLEERIRSIMSVEESLPAVGQGAIGVECRLNDTTVLQQLAPLNDPATESQVQAERAMNAHLKGGCQVPIGSYAKQEGDTLWLRALVGAPDGSQILRGERRGHHSQAKQLGIELAEELLIKGAAEILQRVYQDHPLA